MQITTVLIKNFRGYKNTTVTPINKLTAFVGQNDIGKSTLLEALDIFFNDGKNIIKMDRNDINVNSDSNETIIGVTFKNFPTELIVDTSVPTSLKEEYLLNSEDELEIHKIYRNGSLKETVIIANYPNSPMCADLHQKKKEELKQIVEAHGLGVADKRKSSLLRKAIFSSVENPILEKTSINITAEGAKQIWTSLKDYIPMYELFQSDRKNHDQDSEIQSPIKVLINEVLKSDSIAVPLQKAFKEIEDKTKALVELTIEKLNEMNPELAKELNANFDDPSWEKAFKFSLDTENHIPVNKRGSGARRLILLNFFRAEAERRKSERNVPNIIYAFEEPETSQHPKHQQILIDAFLEMINSDVNQVLLTTHSPSIAKMLPTDSLRLISKNESGDTIIKTPNESIFEEIVDALGIYPSIEVNNPKSVSLAICVEGKNDITFLKHVNNKNSFKSIIDICSEHVIILPMGGSTLQFWVNDNYLEKLNVSQLHIYDSDKGSNKPNKYSSYVTKINSRENSKAFETSLREFENYISKTALAHVCSDLIVPEEIDWTSADIPELLAKHTHESDPQHAKSWEELDEKKKKDKKSKAKNRLNDEILKITLENHYLEEECFNEIKLWFETAKELLHSTTAVNK